MHFFHSVRLSHWRISQTDVCSMLRKIRSLEIPSGSLILNFAFETLKRFQSLRQSFALAHFVRFHLTSVLRNFRYLFICPFFKGLFLCFKTTYFILLNGTQKLRFWLCLPQKNLTFSQLFLGDPGISLSWILLELRFLALRFKFLIQGIFRYAKASHPSHFGLCPSCYVKSAK